MIHPYLVNARIQSEQLILLNGLMSIEDDLRVEDTGIGSSKDYERYMKMALRIAPNEPSLHFK